MLKILKSFVIVGVEPVPVNVEVFTSKRSFPRFDIVGLVNKSVIESKNRITSAIRNSGYDFRSVKVTINLAPAGIKKEGTYFDLPIALGILASLENIEVPKDVAFFGELSLDGTLRSSQKIYAFLDFAKKHHYSKVVVPYDFQNNLLAGILEPQIFLAKNLEDAFLFLKGEKTLDKFVYAKPLEEGAKEENFLWDHVKGQQKVKRALEISAAGKHPIFLQGPPGCGKSMLVKGLVQLLPELSLAEKFETAKIYSCLDEGSSLVAALLEGNLPFRSPHHSISIRSLMGGVHPGEVTLSHNGILFLDEFHHLSAKALEALRQPMESGYVSVLSGGNALEYPCNFLLVAASNPCACGYYTHPKVECKCTPYQVQKYSEKISGPLKDRFHLWVRVGAVSSMKNDVNGEAGKYKYAIAKARLMQQERWASIVTNSIALPIDIVKVCQLGTHEKKLIEDAKYELNLSMRGFMNLHKVSRTIADLEDSSKVYSHHILEALEYIPHEGREEY